jgi:hypothetical protein
MKIIHLRDALAAMKDPKPFSVTFVKCDISRDKGGDIMKLENVILSINQGRAEDLGFQVPDPNLTNFSKDPNNYEHATRNLLLKNGMRKKFHIRLLLEFNGQKVFY